MPASRASRQPLQAQHAPNYADAEVIVLSSDDDDVPPPPRKAPGPKRTSKQRGKTRARTSPVVDTGDVLEISSEEDNAVRRKDTSRSTIAALQKKLAQAQREIEVLRAHTSSRVASPTSTPAVPPIRITNDQTILRAKETAAAAIASKKHLLGEIEEHITCEICTLKMWTPYLLPCGHSFCQSCLQDWFNTTLAHHMEVHPGYNSHPPVVQQYLNYLRQPNLPEQQRRAGERQLQNIYDAMEHPNYTCPTCRETVKTPPIESFALKHVVRTVAQAEGENSPRRTVPGSARRNESPWSGFFPKLTS